MNTNKIFKGMVFVMALVMTIGGLFWSGIVVYAICSGTTYTALEWFLAAWIWAVSILLTWWFVEFIWKDFRKKR